MTVLLRAKRRSPDTGSRMRARIHRDATTRPLPTGEAAARLLPTGDAAARLMPTRTAAIPARREGERRGPPTQDRALYNCGCGYVFCQDVSTSVACPHCGDAQAW